MNMKQTKLIVAPAAVVVLAPVPYVTVQESRIEYQYSTGMVNLTADYLGVIFPAYNQTLRKSDMK